MEEREVLIKNVDKLRQLGFTDGYERATKILQTNPDNLDLLDIVNLPSYQEGYLEGIEEAKKQYGIISEDKSIVK